MSEAAFCRRANFFKTPNSTHSTVLKGRPSRWAFLSPRPATSLPGMGITGNLPLKPATEQGVPLNRFRGKLIAVDGNVWIHRGTHACAVELAQGVPTMACVHYCRNLCEMCVSQGLRLLVVFDDHSLPAKGPSAPASAGEAKGGQSALRGT